MNPATAVRTGAGAEVDEGSTVHDRRRSRAATLGYAVLLAACALFSLTWLTVGAIVAVAAHVPPVAAHVAAVAATGNEWARGLEAAIPRGEPAAQAIVDYAFSLVNIGLAAVLLASRRSSWSARLLALALIGSAGAFNLQAHAAAAAVQVATGFAIGGLHQVVLHGVACAAYILALMLFPADRIPGSGASAARNVVVAAGVGTLLLVGVGTALLAHTISCVLFFGFGVPVAGLLVLPRRIRHGTTVAERTQARLLFSVLVAAFAIVIVLASISVLLSSIGWTGLALVDPTAHPGTAQPIALLFWFSRLACVAVAGAMLVATRPGALWTAERLFSRGLVALLVTALIGAGYIVVNTVAGYALDPGAGDGGIAAAALATGSAALAFLPVYVYAERLVDRLLYGTRPAPYSVLAGITALSQSGTSDAPDLERVAEAVGRGLSASTCRLTVIRPGLRDRTYTWAKGGAHASDELVEVPVRQGVMRIGTIEVDHAAIAGLQEQRRHLLEDIADSLGAVLQASRFGIELERQLRAALAHATEIADARRAAAAEMDGERRRIERNLHDGAQHHLVSLRLTLGLVEHQVSTGQLDLARGRLDQVLEQIDTAESVLAETAMGVSSPLLAERGLIGALATELGAGHPPVIVDSDGVAPGQRFPADIESAVYFCCLEAVNNARKHAPGAAIGVHLSVADARLHLVVRDDGPGWDPAAASGSPGHGLRNVTSRIGAVGGLVRVRSALGAGTTVEGSVPLPDGYGDDGRAPAPHAVPETASTDLLDQVRHAVRVAHGLYQATRHAEPLRALGARLDGPVRVAVVGPAGAGTSTLVEALRPPTPTTGPTLIDLPGLALDGRAGQPADAFVVLLRHRRPDDAALFSRLLVGAGGHRPPPAVGVLARADEAVGTALTDPGVAERAAAECGARADVRRICPVVVPVAGLLARAAAATREADYAALARLSRSSDTALARLGAAQFSPSGTGLPATHSQRADVVAPAPAATVLGGPELTHRELLDRYGLVGVRLSIELIRSGRAPSAEALAAALLSLSGLPRLRELVDTRFVRRAETLKSRSALWALDTLVRSDPPPGDSRPLLYLLERIQSGAHEFTELDLVDALQAGEHDLPEKERQAAETLLGSSGPDPRTRLSLAPDAGPQEVARAAAEQLAHWRRVASHPAASTAVRTMGPVLVRTCERLLAGAQ
ncbi:hypothetical protein GCM10009609_31720 [Pseudonocardia aurantiaca]|uniref:histidine kinase n=1 Tax=Pseudonocardia aurantiaca TaxID=75290 RepID=A0ABW4FWA9_9PSEU